MLPEMLPEITSGRNYAVMRMGMSNKEADLVMTTELLVTRMRRGFISLVASTPSVFRQHALANVFCTDEH